MSALKVVGMVGLRMSVRSRVVQEGFMNLKKDSSGPTAVDLDRERSSSSPPGNLMVESFRSSSGQTQFPSKGHMPQVLMPLIVILSRISDW